MPCWDAVVLIVLAEATGGSPSASPCSLAFSLGMAVVLVAVGVMAGKVRGSSCAAPARDGDGAWDAGSGSPAD